MAKAKAKPKQTPIDEKTTTYNVISPVLHARGQDEACRYDPGDTIDLTEYEAESLLEAGAVQAIAEKKEA